MAKLNIKEKATNYETMMHILQVQKALNKIIVQLMDRGRLHDRSKLESPEVELFTKYTPELEGLTYGTPEYQESLDKLKPALDHHYANNRHHPEHYPDGIAGMDLVDVLELMADWFASSKRQNNGNLRMSLEDACKRFNIDPQLASILRNTIPLLEENIE